MNYFCPTKLRGPVVKLTTFVASGFGGLVVSMLDSGTQDRGFEPGQSMPSFGGEVKHVPDM
jgi:hypothetical protein